MPKAVSAAAPCCARRWARKSLPRSLIAQLGLARTGTKRVTSSTGGGEAGMGLQFLQLAPQAKEAIKAFIKRRDSLFFNVD